MKIKTHDKEVSIPNWIVLVGILAVDNVVANLCKTSSNKSIFKNSKKK